MTTSTPIDVTGVDFVLIPTQDLARARAFYTDVLGLEPSSVWQRDGQPALGAEFETGTVTLALIDTAMTGREYQAGAGAVALQVPDVAAAREQLIAQGVTFVVEEIDSGVCHQAIFLDSEGNTLVLHHRYAPRASS